jgi:hypothetical protein
MRRHGVNSTSALSSRFLVTGNQLPQPLKCPERPGVRSTARGELVRFEKKLSTRVEDEEVAVFREIRESEVTE